MLAFVQQEHLQLSGAVLPFWVSLLQQSGKGDDSAARRPPLPEDAAAALLHTAGESCTAYWFHNIFSKDKVKKLCS